MKPVSPVIHSDPDILGGIPVFVGTRVPVKTLLDYLEACDPLDESLDHFPSVGREQAIAALELAKEMLTLMRILLDECVARLLKGELSDCEIRTVVEMGLSGTKNGELLQLMDADRLGIF